MKFENLAILNSPIRLAALLLLSIQLHAEPRLTVLIGPGRKAFGSGLVTSFIENLRSVVASQELTVIGNGDNNLELNLFDVRKAFQQPSLTRHTIIMLAHGETIDDEFCLDLGSFVSLKSLFGSSRPEINAFILSCDSISCLNEECFSKKSFVVTTSDGSGTASSMDVKRFAEDIRLLASHRKINSMNLLMIYLTKSLKNRMAPQLLFGEKRVDTEQILAETLGKPFSVFERAKIVRKLRLYSDQTATKLMMDRMETAENTWSISAEHFGMAIAISIAAQKFNNLRPTQTLHAFSPFRSSDCEMLLTNDLDVF